jgi:hypothetical protein
LPVEPRLCRGKKTCRGKELKVRASSEPNDLPVLPDMRDPVRDHSGRSRDPVIAGMCDVLRGSSGGSCDPLIAGMRDVLTSSSGRSGDPIIRGMCDLMGDDSDSACDPVIRGGRCWRAPCPPYNLAFAVKIVRKQTSVVALRLCKRRRCNAQRPKRRNEGQF